ncbi:MDR family MFS transporter [Bacillus thuringiensis]|uniref:MDR family MFS transporter n=1 Tax=Bacillus thuringiensis TaxID=1428 RepID=UPI000BF85F02|nr:MFS transporter [Bacillus thuringiensis]PES33324.1 MFS transporter [Bacillus thuringiensis]
MRFRDLHKNIKLRIIETFTSQFVNWMIFPFMTIYLANYFGTKTAGLLLIINVFVGLSMSFIGGYFGDHFGRKRVILSAESIRFLAFTTMMLSNSPWFVSPTITFMMMTVNTICWGLAGPANQAMLIDVSTPEQRKLMYSINYWANNLSMAIGGMLGALLFKDYLFELLIALTIATGSVVILITFFIDESYAPQEKKLKPLQHISHLLKNYNLVLKDRLFVLFAIASILITSMEMQLTNYVGIRLTNEMVSQSFLFWDVDGIKMLGFLRSENTILVVILALYATKLTNFMKDRTTLVASCAIFSLGYGVIAYSNNISILVICMLLLTIGEVLRVPVEQSYMASIPPDNARSTYMAVIGGIKYNLAMLIASSTVFLGSFVPSTIMALLITSIGITGTIIYLIITPGLDIRKAQQDTKQIG